MVDVNHRALLVWQEAMELVELVYRETARFPKEEVYGLTSQMRRSAISIPSNIAEGAGRNSANELMHFIGIASGSRAELDTQLEVARRLALVPPESKVFEQLARVGRLLTGLRSSLKKRQRE